MCLEHVPQHGPPTRPTTCVPNTSHNMGLEHVPQHGPRTHLTTWVPSTSHSMGPEHVPRQYLPIPISTRRHPPVPTSTRGTRWYPPDSPGPQACYLPIPTSTHEYRPISVLLFVFYCSALALFDPTMIFAYMHTLRHTPDDNSLSCHRRWLYTLLLGLWPHNPRNIYMMHQTSPSLSWTHPRSAGPSKVHARDDPTLMSSKRKMTMNTWETGRPPERAAT